MRYPWFKLTFDYFFVFILNELSKRYTLKQNCVKNIFIRGSVMQITMNATTKNDLCLTWANDVSKWAISASFSLFLCNQKVDSKHMFNTKLAIDWIQIADLWSCKWPLYQMSPNHCPLGHRLLHFTCLLWQTSHLGQLSVVIGKRKQTLCSISSTIDCGAIDRDVSF